MLKKLKYSAAILLTFTVGTTAVAQTPKGMKILGMSDFDVFDEVDFIGSFFELNEIFEDT